MDLKKAFGTNAALENEGVWYDLDETTRVKVARDGNPAHVKALREITGPYKMQINRGTIADEVVLKLNIEAMSRAILVDWVGIEDNGQPVPYSADAARTLLTAYPDFRKTIKSISEDIATFQQAQEAAITKN